MKLIRKLLRSHLSAMQLAGFMLTNLVGVAIVLTAVQIYSDVRPALSQPDSFLTNDYLIISKKVSALSVLGGGINKFSRDELDELAAKSFITDMGEFTTARYSVTGRVAVAGTELSTFLFFESVPDRFLDVKGNAWRFAEGDKTIPIILPKNYLNLYNFGFAQSQGLPQVSPDLFKLITFDLSLSGSDRTEHFKGRVAAFSNRINTILVPQSFMEWSNAELASDGSGEPSRVMIEVRNAADTELHQYLQSMGYEIEGGNQDGGRTAYFLRMITAVVAGVGGLITVLSFFILMLSIFLLLQKNTRKLENLLLLGYSAAQVSLPYQLLTLTLNMVVLSAAIPLLLWVRSVYLPYMEFVAPGYMPGGIGLTVFIGLVIMLFVTLINCLAIRHKVDSLRRQG